MWHLKKISLLAKIGRKKRSCEFLEKELEAKESDEMNQKESLSRQKASQAATHGDDSVVIGNL